MLFMYGADGDLVDYISTEFYDRSDKYLFWRSVADRVLYVKPKAIVWIAEAWIRSRPKARHQRIDNLPITGRDAAPYSQSPITEMYKRTAGRSSVTLTRMNQLSGSRRKWPRRKNLCRRSSHR